ncbi:hypothetical protein [Peribacillus simplex]|uniref:hypothetical protein n=1 Tax=Peribacillus simplex TaxID=1478 RepID=UPI002853075D|nr:hypothetical protein [Peribacillus simplex]MDR4928468.1 hypothetical protein [Peribacillus simplex]
MSVFRNVFISVILLILFGWGMIAFYYASIDISEFFKDSKQTTMFELNLTPILAFVCIGVIVSFITNSKKKKKYWAKALLLPDEFKESDEREKQITSQACRASYISMMHAFPIITSLLLFYPFISETYPYYPIVIFLLLPLTQVVTYLISWKKNY